MADIPSLSVSTLARRVLSGLAAGLGVALLLLLLRGTYPVALVEATLVDARTRHFVDKERGPDPRIVIAEITETDIDLALREGGFEWPWPDEYLAFVPKVLQAAGAKGLLVDFLYFDRGQDDDEIEGAEREGRKEQREAERRQIEVYAQALRDFGPVALGFNLTEDPVYELPGRVEVARPLAWLKIEGEPPPAHGRGNRADLSVRALLASGRQLGFVNASHGIDGVVRHARPVARWGDTPVPALSLVGARLLEPDVVVTRDAIRVGDKVQRLDGEGRFLINFHAWKHERYTRISPYDLLVWGSSLEAGDPLPKEAAILKDKIVVFGAHVIANEDIVASPIDEQLHGPELQAAVLDNLLNGDGRVSVAPGWNVGILLLLCLGLGVLGSAAKRRLLPLLVSILAAVSLAWVSLLLFDAGWSIDLFTPWMGIGFTSLATTGLRLFTEGKRNRWLEGTFSRYLAPDVIESLKSDPSRLTLGGRRKELTVMFSDIAGFTKLSEQLEPNEVVRLVNRYLTAQSDELMDEGGVIDKFEGDAIMAFFGDPLDMDDHALRACRSAVRCLRALPKLKPILEELDVPDLKVRIGLNTGEALVGNMGSDRRFDYTCMGDSVNLASRLEGANKYFGSVVLIGPRTYEQARDHILAKPLADLIVVGKSEPVAVYELVSLSEDASEAERGHVEAFVTAHEAVLADDLATAREALAKARSLRPDDGPCQWLEGLIDALERGQEGRPWDRQVVLSSK